MLGAEESVTAAAVLADSESEWERERATDGKAKLLDYNDDENIRTDTNDTTDTDHKPL